MSLAGSVETEPKSEANIKGVYDTIPLDSCGIGFAFLDTSKASDTAINLTCAAYAREGSVLAVHIPAIPLSGVPQDVSFDHSVSNAEVSWGEKRHTSVKLSVKGWIREIVSRNPAPRYFKYDIYISGVVDGKLLNIKATDQLRN